MTPREALDHDLEEPDWRARCAEELERWGEDFAEYAFENVLTAWRRFHSAPIEGSTKKMPAPAVDGVIALAGLGIMPPRSLLRGRPQHDDHCWLLSFADGRSWRILTVEDGVMHLDSFGDKKEVEVAKIDWAKYSAIMARALRRGA